MSPDVMSPGPATPEQQVPARPSRRALGTIALLGCTIATVAVVTGISSREVGNARLREWTEAQAVATVAVARPDNHVGGASLVFPGRLEAYAQAQIYARSSGYLKSWAVDIGGRVKAGDLLAEIEAPDLDQQYVQSQADLASAVANAKLSDATLKRGETLLHQNWVSQQDFDQRTADLGNKQGLVKAAQANVDRLQVLEQYKRVVAPFDGLVTARNTDVGALIVAGSAGAPLFVVSDIHRMRVYITVPQNYVPSIKIGTQAQLMVPEYPGRTFPAVIEASAQAVDVASGTTRMQLGIDNPKGELMTGSFAIVHFELPHDAVALSVPANALMFNQSGLRVATVGSDNRVLLKKVAIAHDFGKEVEIASGLDPDDWVIANPPDDINTGDTVRVAGDDAAKSTASVAGPRGNLGKVN